MDTYADPLMTRYYQLTAGMPYVVDRAGYAQDLADLAADFEQAGRPAMAANCQAKAVNYAVTVETVAEVAA